MRQTSNEALAIQYRPLVRRIAKSCKRRMPRAEFDDLNQAGMEGLIQAAARFRGENNASFTSFVGHRISGAMLDSVREGDWTPRSVNRAARDIVKAIRAIEVAEQRPARETEIAERLGLSLPDYRTALNDAAARYIFDFDEAQRAMHVESLSPRPDDEVERERFDADLGAAIAALPEREQRIIEATLEGETLVEIGVRLGVTESRVCQLRTQAVARLRAALGQD